MMRTVCPAVLCFALVVVPSAAPRVSAQAAAQPSATSPAKPNVTALMIEVVIGRYQGDKRVSSLPYTLAVNTDNTTSRLRMGGQIPIPSTTFTPAAADKPAAPLRSYSYRDIGTNIDCAATPIEDGRYKIALTVEDSSVYGDSDTAKADPTALGAPAFRSFRSNNSLSMRNGQTIEFTTAADRITGEVVKLSVKLTVVN
jgi:hypothetical protein